MGKIDPLFKLYNYACDKMYRIIYKTDYGDERAMCGLLIHCHGPLLVLLGEKGMYYIKHKDIVLMEPISMPKNACENYRAVIEDYLKEELEFKRT